MRQYGQLQTDLKFNLKLYFLDLELTLTVRLSSLFFYGRKKCQRCHFMVGFIHLWEFLRC